MNLFITSLAFGFGATALIALIAARGYKVKLSFAELDLQAAWTRLDAALRELREMVDTASELRHDYSKLSASARTISEARDKYSEAMIQAIDEKAVLEQRVTMLESNNKDLTARLSELSASHDTAIAEHHEKLHTLRNYVKRREDELIEERKAYSQTVLNTCSRLEEAIIDAREVLNKLIQ